MNTKNRNDNMDDYDSLLESMNGIVEQMQGLADMAVVEYTLLVRIFVAAKHRKTKWGFCLIICSAFLAMNVCCNCSSTYAAIISIPIPA